MTTNIHKTFLQLVRLGIGHTENTEIKRLFVDDWEALKAFAEEQGLSAVILDGIDRLTVNDSRFTVELPLEMKLEWIGEVFQDYEGRYVDYRKAIGNLAGFYNNHGFKMMVIKGYACSLDWPRPEHRPCGDIDIWLFGKQKEADELLEKEKGIDIDNSHHHHTVFEWNGFTAENHYDFVNVYAHKSSRELEKIFKELGNDDSHFIEVHGEKVYLPSPNLHALFLIRHMAAHFAGAELSLRQVLDWAFFVEKHTEEVDWKWLLELLEKYGMKDFFNCINAICVEELGFSLSIFSNVQFLPSLKEIVLDDILEPAFLAAEPKALIKRIVYKYQRWQGNAWKQELCYNESRWSAFWTGIWAKLLKPAMI